MQEPDLPHAGAYLGAVLLEEQFTPASFNEAVGIPHAAFMTFVDFPEVLNARHPHHRRIVNFMERCGEVGAIPAVTVECFGGLDSYTVRDIELFADFLRDSAPPMILRWNHEMNGSWYPWGQQPVRYVEKFREFARILKDRAPQVAMAWTPNQGWGYPWPGCKHHNADLSAGDPYSAYYPGDDMVDWVGLSFYHWGENRGANDIPPPGKWGAAHGIGNAVTSLHNEFAAGHGKPMMIAETSALYDTTNSKGGGATELEIKRNWIRQVYNLADESQPRLDRDLPQLKAIFWFNIVKHEEEVGGVVDWSVTSNPDVLRIYKEAVEVPYFIAGPGQKK